MKKKMEILWTLIVNILYQQIFSWIGLDSYIFEDLGFIFSRISSPTPGPIFYRGEYVKWYTTHTYTYIDKYTTVLDITYYYTVWRHEYNCVRDRIIIIIWSSSALLQFCCGTRYRPPRRDRDCNKYFDRSPVRGHSGRPPYCIASIATVSSPRRNNNMKLNGARAPFAVKYRL